MTIPGNKESLKGGVTNNKSQLITRIFNLAAVTAAFLVFHPHILGSEQLTVTTYYPAPYGGYARILTTGQTQLARDGGSVVVGASTTTAKMGINGDLMLQQGLPNSTAVNKFSTDGDFLENSDRNIPTEKAVATYVANHTILTGLDRAIAFSLKWTGTTFIHHKTVVLFTKDKNDLGKNVELDSATRISTGRWRIRAKFRDYYMDATEVVSATAIIGGNVPAIKMGMSDDSGNNELELNFSDDSTMNNLPAGRTFVQFIVIWPSFHS